MGGNFNSSPKLSITFTPHYSTYARVLYHNLQELSIRLKGSDEMNALGKLEKMLLEGEITGEEYKERKAVYVELILEMYVMGILSKEEMQDRLNL